MTSAIEQAYRTAMGQCIDAMYSLQRYNGTEALNELRGAIRTIEHGQRKAEEEHRREMARIPRAYVEPPPAPDLSLDF